MTIVRSASGNTPEPVATAELQVPGCVCDLSLPCGIHLRQHRAEEARRAVMSAPTRHYRNTEGLRGHANARKRARD